LTADELRRLARDPADPHPYLNHGDEECPFT
jgi:hypothetical protein